MCIFLLMRLFLVVLIFFGEGFVFMLLEIVWWLVLVLIGDGFGFWVGICDSIWLLIEDLGLFCFFVCRNLFSLFIVFVKWLVCFLVIIRWCILDCENWWVLK